MESELKLLLIEDSEEDAFILLRELKKAGYKTDCTRVDSLEDLTRELEKPWELIISDYNLPGFFALDALKIVKDRGFDIPFIIVSGMIGEETAVAAMKAGAHDYMMKGNLQRLPPAIERELKEAEERRKRKEAERALKTQFSQVSTIFDSMSVHVIVSDLETSKILFLNRQAEQLAGFEWKELTYNDFFKQMQSEADIPDNSSLIASDQSSAFVWEFLNPRTSRWYQCIDRIIEWTDETLVRMFVAIDITEHKEMEKLKDEMLSAVSHEMRTPLTAMLGFTEFLLENEYTPEQLNMSLSTIHKETERLHELISNFLDLQKHKAKRETFQFEKIDTKALIEEAVNLFSGDSGNHQINISVPDPPPSIIGDESKLHQVLNNLISNACKYSPKGMPIAISVMKSGDYIELSVADKGAGIPAEMREKIFEKFYRIDNTDRRQTGGTGLGLALAKEIVLAHHGAIKVLENPGGGSIFMVRIPESQE